VVAIETEVYERRRRAGSETRSARGRAPLGRSWRAVRVGGHRHSPADHGIERRRRQPPGERVLLRWVLAPATKAPRPSVEASLVHLCSPLIGYRTIGGNAFRSVASQLGYESFGSLEVSERKRAMDPEEARDSVGFNFGMLMIIMPAMALFAGAVGVSVQLVTPLEAVISAALVGLWFVLLINEHPLSKPVYQVIVEGTGVIVAWLAPAPVLGPVALAFGMTIVLWLPILLLAIVAWLL
jgi:hypothetical protein